MFKSRAHVSYEPLKAPIAEPAPLSDTHLDLLYFLPFHCAENIIIVLFAAQNFLFWYRQTYFLSCVHLVFYLRLENVVLTFSAESLIGSVHIENACSLLSSFLCVF